jgi:hypothetical protein
MADDGFRYAVARSKNSGALLRGVGIAHFIL